MRGFVAAGLALLVTLAAVAPAQAGIAYTSYSVLNLFRDIFPAACCVLLVCCLATPIPRSLLRGFLLIKTSPSSLTPVTANMVVLARLP